MQNYIIRVVSQDGKLSIRKCITDEDGDVVRVSSEAYCVKGNDMPSINAQIGELQAALRLPIYVLPTANATKGWVDEEEMFSFTEEDIE